MYKAINKSDQPFESGNGIKIEAEGEKKLTPHTHKMLSNDPYTSGEILNGRIVITSSEETEEETVSPRKLIAKATKPDLLQMAFDHLPDPDEMAEGDESLPGLLDEIERIKGLKVDDLREHVLSVVLIG